MKINLTFLYIFYFSFNCLSNQATAQTLDSSNLPIIILDTYGQTISDDPRITIFMGIIDNGPGNINHVTDPYTDYNGEVTIEIRGSTSQQYPKKSYAFTPVDSIGNKINAEILGMPSENDWILYAPYPDKSLIRNTLTYYFANKMGYYSSRTKHVEIVRNGLYRGIYELQEKVKNDNDRVDISKITPADTSGDNLTGGYIIKIDKTTGSGADTFVSSYDSEVFFQFHDPEDYELLPIQKDYITNYVDSFETALMSPLFADPDSGFRKFADENSFINFFLLQELGHTIDGYRSSCFMYKDKDSKDGKLTMGPMWDFNLSYGNADYCQAFDTIGWQYEFNTVCQGYFPHVPFWWSKLLEDTTYQNSVQCRWKQLRETYLHTDSINNWIDSIANYLDESQQRNFIKWPILGIYVNWNYYIGLTYQDEVDYLKMWLEKRSKWLDNNLPGNCIPVISNTENLMPLSFYVSPNPTNGNFYIGFNSLIRNGVVEVTNSLGQKLYSDKINNQRSIELNIVGIASGIYFVKVFDGENQFSKKIIIQNK